MVLEVTSATASETSTASVIKRSDRQPLQKKISFQAKMNALVRQSRDSYKGLLEKIGSGYLEKTQQNVVQTALSPERPVADTSLGQDEVSAPDDTTSELDDQTQIDTRSSSHLDTILDLKTLPTAYDMTEVREPPLQETPSLQQTPASENILKQPQEAQKKNTPLMAYKADTVLAIDQDIRAVDFQKLDTEFVLPKIIRLEGNHTTEGYNGEKVPYDTTYVRPQPTYHNEHISLDDSYFLDTKVMLQEAREYIASKHIEPNSDFDTALGVMQYVRNELMQEGTMPEHDTAGARSLAAYTILRSLGFTNLSLVKGEAKNLMEDEKGPSQWIEWKRKTQTGSETVVIDPMLADQIHQIDQYKNYTAYQQDTGGFPVITAPT